MVSLLQLVSTIVDIIIFFIIAQVILSWLVNFGIVNGYQPFVQTVGRALHHLTEPLYRPVRQLLPTLGGLDLSPLVIILLLNFFRSLLFEWLL